MIFGLSFLVFWSSLAFGNSVLSPGLPPFPEEATRSQWDLGCDDWPVQIPGQGSPGVLAKNPSIFVEKQSQRFRILASISLSPEPGESLEDLHDSISRTLRTGAAYPKWVLPGINEKVEGGTYFVSLNDLTIRERIKDRQYILTGPYTFNLLWFKRDGTTSLELRREIKDYPLCEVFAGRRDPLQQGDRFLFRMTPRPELIHLLIAELWLVPQKKTVELRIRLVAQPSSLVYQLMPEALLRSELEERALRVFQNFVEARRLSVFSKRAIPSLDWPLTRGLLPKMER